MRDTVQSKVSRAMETFCWDQIINRMAPWRGKVVNYSVFNRFEQFLGTAPIGDLGKFLVGGERNGLAIRVRLSSCCNSLITSLLAPDAEK